MGALSFLSLFFLIFFSSLSLGSYSQSTSLLSLFSFPFLFLLHYYCLDFSLVFLLIVYRFFLIHLHFFLLVLLGPCIGFISFSKFIFHSLPHVRLVFWNSIHLEVASSPFSLLVNSP